MLVSEELPLNAYSPILVTPSGMVIESPAYSLKANSPIVVMMGSSLHMISAVHPLNAYLPILVTLSGIVMLVSEVQSLNAELPIFVPPVITTVLREDGTYSSLS